MPFKMSFSDAIIINEDKSIYTSEYLSEYSSVLGIRVGLPTWLSLTWEGFDVGGGSTLGVALMCSVSRGIDDPVQNLVETVVLTDRRIRTKLQFWWTSAAVELVCSWTEPDTSQWRPSTGPRWTGVGTSPGWRSFARNYSARTPCISAHTGTIKQAQLSQRNRASLRLYIVNIQFPSADVTLCALCVCALN